MMPILNVHFSSGNRYSWAYFKYKKLIESLSMGCAFTKKTYISACYCNKDLQQLNGGRIIEE